MTSSLEILASYVSPFVLRRLSEHPSRPDATAANRRAAAVLFADVSGFTSLAETLAERLENGAEELSRVLNAYFSALVDVVHENGGDVIDFPGDAAIAVWSREADQDLEEMTSRAAICALRLQERLGGFDAGEGVRLALKAAVGAGDLWMASLAGARDRLHTLVAGPPLLEMGTAMSVASAGDVVVSPSAWNLIGSHSKGQPLSAGWMLLERVAKEGTPNPRSQPILPADSAELLRPYLLEPTLATVDTGYRTWLAELRRVTVLFANLRGLDYDRSDIFDRAQDAIRVAARATERFGGTVNEIVADDKGTTLVASWGLPSLTHEDDASRALQAAIAIRSDLSSVVEGAAIGVATGRVFCGDRGSDERRDYAMIGQTVNLAARLMQATSEGVLCDEATSRDAFARGVETHVDFESLPPFVLKGYSEPVRVFRVRATGTRESRALLFGRDEERGAIAELLDAVAESKPAETHVLLIEGEPGIGKSSLIAELVREAQVRGLNPLVGGSSAIEASTPYYAWRAVFAQLLGVESGTEDPESRQARVLAILEAADSSLLELAPLLNSVLPLNLESNELTSQMTDQVRAYNTQVLLARLLSLVEPAKPAAGGTGPSSVVVLEDGHWLDSASWALADRVGRDFPGLLAITSRPTTDPVPAEREALEGRPNTVRLRLASLSVEDTRQILSTRLGKVPMDDSIVRFVHTRSGGNPFFAEELAYSLRDSGLIVVQGAVCRIAANAGNLEERVPANLQGTIAARIDQLSPAEQLTVKVSSVIGRVFLVRVLEDVYPVEGDRERLPSYLSTLQRLDMTSIHAPPPELAYLFNHVILQQVAYGLLLHSQRRELHAAIAAWYEQSHAQDLEPLYSTLAHHWGEAAVVDKALLYLDRAGESALRGFANREAIGFLEKAVELVAESRDEEAVGSAEARPAYAQRHAHLAEAYYRLGEFSESEEHSRAALDLLRRKVPEGRGRLRFATARLVAHQLGCRLKPTFFASEAQLDDAARSGLVLDDEIYGTLAKVAFLNDDVDLTAYCVLHSLKTGEAFGPSPELAQVYGNIGFTAGLIPIHSLARSYVGRAHKVISEIEGRDSVADAWVSFTSSFYASGTGDWDVAEEQAANAIRLYERFGDWTQWALAMQVLAKACVYRGQYPRFAELTELLLTSGRERAAQAEQAWCLNNRAEIILNSTNELGRVLEVLEEALALPFQHSAALNSHALEAVVHLRLDHADAARESATAALALIEESQPSSHGLLVGYFSTATTLLALRQRPELQEDRALAHQIASANRCLRNLGRVFPIARPRALLCQGLELRLDGKSKARKLWEKALDEAQHLRLEHDAALVRLELGRQPDEGDETRASHLARALETLETLGVQYDAKIVQESLSRLEPAI